MPVLRVPLMFSGWPAAWIAEPSGADELAAEESGTAAAIALIDRLLLSRAGALPPGAASNLCACDRDQILVAVHLTTFGDRIETPLRCEACESPYELSFSLTALRDHIVEHRTPAAAVAPCRLRLADGRRLRLPEGHEECAAAEAGAEAAAEKLRNLCADGAAADETLLAALESAAPLMTSVLEATCPECERRREVTFDLQHFFMQAMMGERARVLSDVHKLASAYRWTLPEILALRRSDRRALVATLEAEADRARWAAAAWARA